MYEVETNFDVLIARLFLIFQDFIDIILSKTQRKTPTVIHKNYKISRIRSFYMRKIKYTQSNFHDRLTQIIQEFPKLDVSINNLLDLNILLIISQ